MGGGVVDGGFVESEFRRVNGVFVFVKDIAMTKSVEVIDVTLDVGKLASQEDTCPC